MPGYERPGRSVCPHMARIAAEELTWLWPDLETAATADDTDTALAASEALERLREGMFGFAE